MARSVTQLPQDVSGPTTILDMPDWMSPTEAARYLGVSRETIYRLMRQGKLAYSRTSWSGRRRIRKEDLDRLLSSGDTQ